MDQDDLRALKESRPTWLEDGFGLKGPPTPQPRAVQSPLDDAFYGRHVRQGHTSGGGGVGGGGASATVTPPTAPPLPPTTTTPPQTPWAPATRAITVEAGGVDLVYQHSGGANRYDTVTITYHLAVGGGVPDGTYLVDLAWPSAYFNLNWAPATFTLTVSGGVLTSPSTLGGEYITTNGSTISDTRMFTLQSTPPSSPVAGQTVSFLVGPDIFPLPSTTLSLTLDVTITLV